MACGFLCSSCLTHAVLANLDGAATELVSVQCSNGSCGVVRRLEPNDSKSLGSALHVSLHISIHRRELAEQILELLPRHRPRKVSNVHTVGSRRGKTKLFFRSCSDSGFGF